MGRGELGRGAGDYRKWAGGGIACDRITKDSENRLHACLIPWDALDELSEKERSVTGHKVDYKRYDINNVLILPEVLRQRETSER